MKKNVVFLIFGICCSYFANATDYYTALSSCQLYANTLSSHNPTINANGIAEITITNAIKFTKIYTLSSNGNSENKYRTSHSPSGAMGLAYYRLKIIDKHGAHAYSNIIKLSNPLIGTMHISPNNSL